MNAGSGALLILVGILTLYVIGSGKGACVGGAIACIFNASNTSATLGATLPQPIAPIGAINGTPMGIIG